MQEATAKEKRPHQLSIDGMSHDEDDEEEYAGTLTAQLAETAVGVREMSKQLGAFAFVRSFTYRGVSFIL